MRLLSFIAKLAFLCNFFFVVCMLVRYAGLSISQSVAGFVIIVGWILSFIFNLLFASYLLSVVVRNRKTGIHWLLVTFNILCLPFQVAFIFLLNR